jgi:glycosyl transferase family 25
VINLASRPDRMASMERQLGALRLRYERLDAVDAETVSDSAIAAYWPPEVKIRDTVTRGAKCCLISHRKAWERFLATGEPWAAVLEDDARLHPDCAHFLSDENWLPESAGLIKIEVNFLRRSGKILIGKALPVGGGYKVAPLLSKHMGTGGYVLSRRCAETLIGATRKPTSDIDGVLFNPNISPVFAKLRPLQLCPALVAQSTENGASDLLKWRTEMRKSRTRGVRHALASLRRSYEEARHLPKSALALLLGRAQFAEVGFGQPAGAAADNPNDWAVRSPFQ